MPLHLTQVHSLFGERAKERKKKGEKRKRKIMCVCVCVFVLSKKGSKEFLFEDSQSILGVFWWRTLFEAAVPLAAQKENILPVDQ